MFRYIRVVAPSAGRPARRQVRKLPVFLLLAAMLCGCVDNTTAVAGDEAEPTMLDAYLVTSIEDAQSLSLAIRFVDQDSSPSEELKEILVGMLGDKLDDLTRLLPVSENEDLVALACRVHKQTSGDVFAVTRSCRETDLCDKAHSLAEVCVARGFAKPDEILIPQQ